MNNLTTIPCRGISLEIIDTGSGRPVVFLHPGEGIDRCQPFLDGLAELGRLLVPSHPGFGRSALPAHFRRPDDLAFFYLDLFKQLSLEDAVIVGCGLGGWIAAEMAIRSTQRISRMVLIGSVGARFASDETEVEIADIFTLHPSDVEGRRFVDPGKWRRDHAALSDEDLHIIARNRENLCLFGWAPYMNNPSLRHWLHRIDRPTLVLWGEHDRIAPPDYGHKFAAAIPGAEFVLVRDAAHHPQIEQPEQVLAAIRRFAV